MHTELENLKQQIITLEENSELITRDIVRVMPSIISLLSKSEKQMEEFHEMRSNDQEILNQIKGYIKRENDILSKIINDYGSLQDVANEIASITRKELIVLSNKEKEIAAKISEIPEKVIVKHQYGIDLKSTPIIIIMSLLSVIISIGLGVLFEKKRQLDMRKSYEMRYRMMELELPNATSHIDSSYSLNPNKFHDLVIKREEQQRLKWSIKEKQREIRELQN